MPSISLGDVKKIAVLANITLTTEEELLFQNQLSQILDYVNQLQSVDTSNVSPTSQVTGLENIVRNDISQTCLSQETVLEGTTNRHNGYFKVKAILSTE